MGEDVLELPSSVTKAARPGEDVACLLTQARRKMLRFSKGEFTVSQAWDEGELAILIRASGKVAIGATLDLSKSGALGLLERLRKTAAMTKPRDDRSKLAPRRSEASAEAAKEPDDQTMVKAVLDADESATSHGAERTAIVLNSENLSWALSTTTGFEGRASSSSSHLVVRAFRGQGSGQGVSAARSFAELDPISAGKRAGEIAFDSKDPQKGEEGYFDVVLDPSIFANLLESVAFSASAYAVEAGFSFFANKLGKEVSAEDFTLYDDAREEGLLRRPFDDEGYATQRTPVIKNGILTNYLTNSHYSNKLGLPNTGNAGWIEPRPWNVVVEPGKAKEQDVFYDDCIYITNNWYTRFQNYLEGDFSTILRDGVFLVKNGERVKALKGLRLSDNLPRMLSSISDVSATRYMIRWWEVEIPTLLPFVRVKQTHLTVADRPTNPYLRLE